jgi:hypothetical protein
VGLRHLQKQLFQRLALKKVPENPKAVPTVWPSSSTPSNFALFWQFIAMLNVSMRCEGCSNQKPFNSSPSRDCELRFAICVDEKIRIQTEKCGGNAAKTKIQQWKSEKRKEKP